MSKYLTILLFVFSCFFARANTIRDTVPGALPAPYNTQYYRIGSLVADSTIIVSRRDTNFIPKYPGGITFWQHPGVDSSFWGWDGRHWSKLGTSAGGVIQFLYGNNLLGTVTAINIDTSLKASISGGVGTIINKLDSLTLIYPLYAPLPTVIAEYQGYFNQNGFIDSNSYKFFWYKQNQLQFQLNGANVGSLGGIVHLNFSNGFGMTTTDSTVNITVSPSGNNNISWINQFNSLVAGPGVATVYKADSGTNVSLSGDTIKLKVQKDTIYAGNLLTASRDTLHVEGTALYNTHLNFSNSHTLNLDSLGLGLYFNQLGNESSLSGTDSVLINTSTGKVLKVPKSAVGNTGTVSAAINGTHLSITGDSVLMGGSFIQNTSINAQTYTLDIHGNNAGYSLSVEDSINDGISIYGANNAIDAVGGNDGVNVTGGVTGVSSFGGIFGAAIRTTSGTAVLAESSTGKAGWFQTTPASNNSTSTVLLIDKETTGGSGHGANGIGGSIDYQLPLDNGAGNVTTQLVSVLSTVTNTAPVSQFQIWGLNGTTSPQQQLTVKGTGQLQLNNYTSTSSFTGTAVGTLGFDAGGNVITLVGTGGGSVLTRQNITSGTSATVTAGNYLVQFNFASVAATYTLTMPPTSSLTDQQVIEIQTGTTIAAGSPEITSFTVSPNAGETINGTTVFTLNGGNVIRYRWNATGTFFDLQYSH